MISKSEFRLAMKDRLMKLSENDRRVESQILVRELRKFVETSKARSIGAYIPFKDEPNIRSLLEEWIHAGFTVSIPHVENNAMHFVHVRTLEGVGISAIGTPDPTRTENTDKVDERSMDIVLVPGRAFTRDGNRMGRGNGGYDRWIHEQRKRNPLTKYVGVCFECQLVQEMPTDPHDEKVDVVITASKMLESGR